MSGSEKKKVNRNTYNFSSIKRVSRKLLEVSRCSRANQRQKNVQKSVLYVQSCFLLIRPIFVFVFVFTVLVVFTVSLALHDFIFCSRKLLISKRAPLLALAKSIYYNVTVSVLPYRGVPDRVF